jgi:hypothetical protein
MSPGLPSSSTDQYRLLRLPGDQVTLQVLVMSRSRIGPDPVSCQSCRSKKLRCNRVQPCSNCTSRGVTCQFLLSPRRRGIESPSTIQNNAKILKRIERLESLVLSTHGSQNAHLVGLPPTWSGTTETVTPNICEQPEKVFEDLENVGSIEDSPVRFCYNRVLCKPLTNG